MSTASDVEKVKRNIATAFLRREAAVFAISARTAADALADFQKRQRDNEFWENQTGQALDRMFAEPFREENSIGWFISHGVNYGVYLELANNRKNQSLRPIVQKFAPGFRKEVRKLYSDS